MTKWMLEVQKFVVSPSCPMGHAGLTRDRDWKMTGHSIKVGRTFGLIWEPYLPRFIKYDVYFSCLIWHVTCVIIPSWQEKFID